MKGATIFSTLESRLSHVWHRVLDALKVDTEPHIWRTVNHGKSCWHAYDPTTGYCVDFGSEDDVRVWLEERYYAH